MPCPLEEYEHAFNGYLTCALDAASPCATKALAGDSITMADCAEACSHTDGEGCVGFSLYTHRECWLYSRWDPGAERFHDDNSIVCHRAPPHAPPHIATASTLPAPLPPPFPLPPRPLQPPSVPVNAPRMPPPPPSPVALPPAALSLRLPPSPAPSELDAVVRLLNRLAQLHLPIIWASSITIGVLALAACCACALSGCCSTTRRRRRSYRHELTAAARVLSDDEGDDDDDDDDDMAMLERRGEEAMLVRERPPQTLLVELNGTVCGTVPVHTAPCRSVAHLRRRVVAVASGLTGGLGGRSLVLLEYLDEAANLAIRLSDDGQLPVALSVPTLKATFASAAYRRHGGRGGIGSRSA